MGAGATDWQNLLRLCNQTGAYAQQILAPAQQEQSQEQGNDGRLPLPAADRDKPEPFQLGECATLCVPADAIHRQHAVGDFDGIALSFPMVEQERQRHPVSVGALALCQALDPSPWHLDELPPALADLGTAAHCASPGWNRRLSKSSGSDLLSAITQSFEPGCDPTTAVW